MAKSHSRKLDSKGKKERSSESQKVKDTALKRTDIWTNEAEWTPQKDEHGKIVRPPGQVGRRQGGFPFQPAVGLVGHDRKYRRMLRTMQQLAGKHLDLSKTFRGQSKQKVELVVARACKTMKFFNRFADFWPARECLKQFLGNHVRHERANADESDNSSTTKSSDSEDDSGEESENGDAEGKDMHDGGRGDDDDDEETENGDGSDAVQSVSKHPKMALALKKARATKVSSKTASRLSAKATQSRLDDTPRPSKKQSARAVITQNAASSSKGSTAVLKKVELVKQEKEEMLVEPDGITPKRPKPRPAYIGAKKAETSPVTADDVQGKCPGCESHLVPLDPSDALLSLFQKRRNLQDAGAQAPDEGRIDAAICDTITKERKLPRALCYATSSGWPKVIDWPSIPARVLAMAADLRELAEDARVRKHSVAWETISSCGVNMDELPKSRRLQEKVQDMIRPGYYGSKGTAVICSTLLRIFPPSENLSRLVRPWSTESFTRIILVPSVACRLIRDDLDKFNDEGGWEQMEKSAEVGELLNPEEDDDKVFDAIHNTNIRAVRDREQAEEHKSRKSCKHEITLDDFNEPLAKSRKKRKASGKPTDNLAGDLDTRVENVVARRSSRNKRGRS